MQYDHPTSTIIKPSQSSLSCPSSPSTPSTTSTKPKPTPLLLKLPPELISHTLSLLPPSDLQQTSIALKRVLPELPVEKKLLWTHLVVRRGEQLVPLWRRLRDEERGLSGDDEGDRGVDGGWEEEEDERRVKGRKVVPVGQVVHSFCMESWKGDADIMNNVLRCLPHLKVIMVNLGINVAPEHLSDMFYEPRLDVQRIEMRFRPYVEQASYYQFLKGSYFDTGIETMYKHWPAIPSFTHLSIVQDLPPRNIPTPQSLMNSLNDLTLDSQTSGGSSSEDDEDNDPTDSTPPTSISSADLPVESKSYTGHGPFPYISEKMNYTKPKTFAQPIVFFDIKCLARFGVSPVARHLTHLRLRVPSRDLAYVLVSPPNVPGRPANSNVLFPSLKYIDISTTNVRLDSVLQTLLKSYTRLEHLVLDRVNLFGFAARDRGGEFCHELGGLCVTSGLARSKELERQIAAWEVAERTRFAEAEAQRRRMRAHTEEANEDESVRAAREAERRSEEFQAQIAEAARLARRGHRSAAHSTFSLRDRTLRQTRGQTSSALSTNINLPPQDTLILILPPLPTLKSISIGGEAMHVPQARVKDWEHEFHKGWREGLGKVYGWAGHIADKYDRAVKKAEEWKEWDLKQVKGDSKGTEKSSSSSSGSKHTPHKSKKTTSSSSSASSSTSSTRPKPPTTIRIYRYPHPKETHDPTTHPSPLDHTAGLIEVLPNGRDYLDPYKSAISDAELYTHDHSYGPPCVFCTVPDCEGPLRRGAEGEKLDGRGGMGGVHRMGCGHEVGRRTWGWEGF